MYWSETGFSDPTMRIEIPVNMLKFKHLCLKNNLFCLQYAMIMLLFSTKEALIGNYCVQRAFLKVMDLILRMKFGFFFSKVISPEHTSMIVKEIISR